jgi:lysophospholipase L1-like esterase
MPTAGAPAMHEDLGKGDGADVITIGDSWMSNTLGTGNAIEGALSRLTQQPYRNYGVQGVLLTQSGLFGAAIPTQYDSAKRRDPDIKTVIMTGGGNDIIQDAAVQASCETGGDACIQTIMKINMTLNTLWTAMSNDGVQDVVYIRYSDDAGSTAPNIREMGRMPPAICTMGKIRCHSIETTEAVMADLIDGIHPSQAANNRIAKVVADYMEKNGIRR